MSFAAAPPWWLAAAALLLVVALAIATYRRLLVTLSTARRIVLITLRAATLAALVLILFRPSMPVQSVPTNGAVVPVLIDVSASMRLPDAGGRTRLQTAQALVDRDVLPGLTAKMSAPVYTIGDRVAPAAPGPLTANAPRSDLSGALEEIRLRYRGQPVPAIVVVSDGGDTGTGGGVRRDWNGPPVFAVGVGSNDSLRDRAVVSVSAGEPYLDQATVDIHASLVSLGFGRAPFQVRLLANGRTIETRQVSPIADGAPIDAVFTVSPDPAAPTVYSAEIVADPAELVPENNSRAVLVNPAGRRRRLLVIEGAPGFEQSFLTRAWARDPGLDVDAIVRKGRNAEGQDTFFVQAGAGRATALTTGFPARREDLYAYDVLVLANVDRDLLTRAQMMAVADFTSERGGGLLVLGGRSFGDGGLAGTPLEEVLPVELGDRGGLVPTATANEPPPARNRVALTAAGASHPVMRIGSSPAETKRLWSAIPPLGGLAPLGAPRPGAEVLALSAGATGAPYPLVAVQTYGQGRSLVFAGEASWRWRMLLPSTDRSYEFFWRQAARWLGGRAPEPVVLRTPDRATAGDSVEIQIDARDRAFLPVSDATIQVAMQGPDGVSVSVPFRRGDAAGNYRAGISLEKTGLYHLHGEVRTAGAPVSSVDRWIDVPADTRELADPRLNEGFLQRVARATNGRYLNASEAATIPSLVETAPAPASVAGRREVWQAPWVWAVIVSMLAVEWTLRRRWGLR